MHQHWKWLLSYFCSSFPHLSLSLSLLHICFPLSKIPFECLYLKLAVLGKVEAKPGTGCGWRVLASHEQTNQHPSDLGVSKWAAISMRRRRQCYSMMSSRHFFLHTSEQESINIQSSRQSRGTMGSLGTICYVQTGNGLCLYSHSNLRVQKFAIKRMHACSQMATKHMHACSQTDFCCV